MSKEKLAYNAAALISNSKPRSGKARAGLWRKAFYALASLYYECPGIITNYSEYNTFFYRGSAYSAHVSIPFCGNEYCPPSAHDRKSIKARICRNSKCFRKIFGFAMAPPIFWLSEKKRSLP